MSLQRARLLRRRMSAAEARMWNLLRMEPLALLHFRRQVSLGPYYADFASHAAKIVIEIDGSQHTEDAALAYDARRDAFLRRQGFLVVRITTVDVMDNLNGVFEMLVSVAPPPTGYAGPPSPQGGGSPD